MRTRTLTVAAATLTTVAAVAVLAVPGTEAASTKTVRVVDNRFSPTTLTVKAGTKVKFVWSGTMTQHDVTVRKAPKNVKKVHSKLMQSGSYSTTFRKKGTYKIVCTIHESFMTMTVKVK
ncbi:cupredoxin domain-containing protein [Patulibacter minatonensis]|uniref:cupredoxin domain-containing protein n=1 Tax=Patulibacter minatonensis TaxID=298163 RepID=UPI0004B1AE3A|nr:plastocyanin/azurin family copper-binding protein [Patulibacter minatonensis]